MRERSDDRARSGAKNPDELAIRWFIVDEEDWTPVYAVEQPGEDDEPVDQYVLAKHTRFHHARNQWVPIESRERIWDPTVTSGFAEGALVRCVFNAENRHWEIEPDAIAETNLVEYLLNLGVEGWDVSPINPRLNVDFPNGWIGSTARSGEETYIQYQADEATPSTSGNFKVLRAGYFKLSLFGWITLTTKTTPIQDDEVYDTSDAGGHDHPVPVGGAGIHSHTVTIPNYNTGLASSYPEIQIELWSKSPAGAIALHEDEVGERYFWRQSFHKVQSAQMRWHIAEEWNVNLPVGYRFALKFAFVPQVHWEFILVDAYAPRLAVQYLGPRQLWELIE